MLEPYALRGARMDLMGGEGREAVTLPGKREGCNGLGLKSSAGIDFAPIPPPKGGTQRGEGSFGG